MSSYDFTPIDKSTNGISNCMSKTEQPLKLHHAKQYATTKCHPILLRQLANQTASITRAIQHATTKCLVKLLCQIDRINCGLNQSIMQRNMQQPLVILRCHANWQISLV